MDTCGNCKASNCGATLSRRGFLAAATTAAGAAAATAAVKAALPDLAPSAPAGEPKPAGKAVIHVIFVRPEQTPVISWPGGNCDVGAQQALFTKTLREAAQKLDVQLELRDKPLNKQEEVAEYIASLKKAPPDGLIVCAMEMMLWAPVESILKGRGDIPTVVYSNLSAFTQHLQIGRNTPKVYVAATQDVGYLATALRMLWGIWRIRNTRILFVAGNQAREATVPGLGMTLHWIPKARFEEEFKKVAASDEVHAIADFYAKNAQRIVEPTPADIVEAAKNYVVCRTLMRNEDCQGIAIDCLGWKNPVCVAYSKLRDEGIVAACEQDVDATIGMLMTHVLFERPTFQQDPSPNTVNNTLIGSHCTSPTRLEGFEQPYRAPYLLRSYHTRTGASPEVLWPLGKPVTILQARANPLSILVGAGRVVSNIPQPPSGCCRTAVEIELDGVADTRDVKGFHQLFILGNLERAFKAYGRLAGIPVAPIA